MKLLLTLTWLSVLCVSKAQNVTATADDFKYLAMHNLNVNTSTITSFSSSEVKGSQYLFDQWTAGSVTTTENVTISQNYLFNFDKLNQNIYANYTSQGNLCVLLDKSKIKYFTIGTQKFINGKLIDPSGKDVFYQVLVEDTSKYSLYKLNITKYEKADFRDVSKVRSGTNYNQYVDNLSYYISQKGTLKKINLTENSIRKVLSNQSKKVDDFFNQNPNKDIDENLLTLLIMNLNQ